MNDLQILGIVVAVKANYLIVEVSDLNKFLVTNSGLENQTRINNRFLCTSRSSLNYKGKCIYVGDSVLIESIDYNSMRAVICDVKPRKNYLQRPALANLNKICIVISAKRPNLNIDQATRFLMTAEEAKIDILIILTKVDLLLEKEQNDILSRVNKWGYDCIPLSNKTGEGIDLFSKSLKAESNIVLCGPSGVGKTSLMNHLISGISLQVRSLSKRIQRGQNTTRNVELFSLGNGARLADTPGFNRPEIHILPKNLQWLFPEITIQLKNKKCKFRDCLHNEEIGCSINKDWERYFLYKKYLLQLIDSHYSYQGGLN